MKIPRTLCLIFCISLSIALMPFAAAQINLGESKPITGEGDFSSPIWRPDGQGLAYAGSKYESLFFTDLHGESMMISDAMFSGWKPAWGPYGQLAYRAQMEEGMGMALMVVGEDGESNQITPWLNDLFPPTWDEDGISFRSGDELITVDEEGNVVRVQSMSSGHGILSRIAGAQASFMLGRISGASFMAFGSVLSSKSAKGKPGKGVYVDPENQIWVMDEDGNWKKLIEHQDEHGFFDPQESPGGDRYAVCGMSGNLYVVDPHGSGELVSLGAGQNPSWSPCGRYLVFERTTDDGRNILSSNLWFASVDGRILYQLTDTPYFEFFPAWSPDGKHIAYVIDGVVYLAPVEE